MGRRELYRMALAIPNSRTRRDASTPLLFGSNAERLHFAIEIAAFQTQQLGGTGDVSTRLL
jgi:hypothetical protein